MPSKVYIAHFYPPEDAANFWGTDEIVEVMGQVFLSHAEAANQLSQELGDVLDSNLPVSAFVIEAVECPEGYRVLDCYELSDGAGSHKRAANPKPPKSAALSPEAFAAFAKEKKARTGGGAASAPAPAPKQTKPKTVSLKAASGKAASGKTAPAPVAPLAPPAAAPTAGKRGRKPQQYVYQSRPTTPVAQRKRVGEVIAGTNEAWLAELEGIERGKAEIKMPKSEAAERYSEFVAEYAPWDVPARKISGAMMKKLRGKTGQTQYEIQFEARKKGNEKAGQELMSGLKSGKLAEGTREEAVEKVKDARLALREAKKANDVPAIEKAQTDLALNEAKANLLATLQAWCPWYCQTTKGKADLEAARKGKLKFDDTAIGYSVIEEVREMEAQARATALAAKRQAAEAKKTDKKAEREDAKNNKAEARRLKAEAREQEKEAKRLEAKAEKEAAEAAKAAAEAAKTSKTTKTTKAAPKAAPKATKAAPKAAKGGKTKAIKASRPKKERLEFTVLTDAELAAEKAAEKRELAKAKTADRKAASTKSK